METSLLQKQYPLSKEKFWKKILSNIIQFFIIYGVLFGGGIGFVVVFFTNPDPSLGQILTFAIIGAIALFALSIGIYAWYVKAYIRTYYYSTDRDFITIKKGVFTPSEIHVQYQKIQDVYVDQDLLDRILGIYDVHIASATVSSGIEAHIDGVDKQSAEGLKHMFLDSMRGGGILNQQAAQSGQSGTGSSMAQSSGPTSINFAEQITDETFPISPRWMTARIIMKIFWAILVGVWGVFLFFGEGKNNTASMAQTFGFETNFQNMVILFLLIAIFLSACQIIYAVLWRKSYKFKFTPEYIYTYEGVISKQEKHLPYNTIQDVIKSQGIIDRLFGIYNVVIQNAASSGMMPQYGKNKNAAQFGGVIIPGQTLERATKLTEMLKANVLSKNSGMQSSTGL